MSSDRGTRRGGLLIAIAAALATSVWPGCAADAAPWPRNARQLPNPQLVDQHGRRVRFYDDLVADRTVVIQFMYTRCEGACPAATSTLVAAQRELAELMGRDVFFVSISIDPARDTQGDLAAYADAHGVGDGWTFVTGAPADIEALRRALGAYDLDPEVDKQRSNHSAMLVVGNDRKDRWTMVSGLSTATAVARAIRRVAGA
jgi:protein SCO1/2